jgi:flavorubredoxin
MEEKMKVAVVFFASGNSRLIASYAQELAKGIESQGYQVDVIDGMKDENKKLAIYQYLAVGTEQISLFGKIHEKIAHFLASMGNVSGKRTFAFVAKKLVGEQRALLRLMKILEKEGMFIKFSEILLSREHALEMGKRLHIDK